ncbi:hypothetical protein Poli38472_005976 [Pythium oligandrum]|uniref:Uncharacterized protein n=1 Tax=Pythium oligandrum TaxID=41045 RepID=A0A8K1CT88_PYTOL|nr:hypothetical protein Poli38472_005976 [Pythium oligandrum]|eukprot:TMW68508.1 hypothetical protein Poli38472_005976 [Pythium oligandrum]
MEVYDAETGERLVIARPLPSPQARERRNTTIHRLEEGVEASRGVSLPLLTSPSKKKHEVASVSLSSPNNREGREARDGKLPVYPESQSTRAMGSPVDWEKRQVARVERADYQYRTSLEGMRRELQRKDLSPIARQEQEIQILEKMKAQYADQIRVMVVEEMERELEREVEMRLELSAIGKMRLRKKQTHDREFYKAQIERVRDECEMSLAATMAQYNLLR